MYVSYLFTVIFNIYIVTAGVCMFVGAGYIVSFCMLLSAGFIDSRVEAPGTVTPT